jgi:uracil-DNA glycosylase
MDVTLLSWASQGVLLLNSALTVEQFKPGSHKHHWKDLISRIIRSIHNYNRDIVFASMGRQAHSIMEDFFLEVVWVHVPHPAFDARTGELQFRETGVFQDINNLIVGPKITW